MSINLKNNSQIIIVGAGITGLTLAERLANEAKKKVFLIEKRDHIGGNCYDYINKNGIMVSKYGPHIFHTNIENVWAYVNKFTKWEKYEHQVLSKVDNKFVPIPVNVETINILFNKNFSNESEMKEFLETKRDKKIKIPKNSKEVVTSKLGEEIYNLMFKGYTKKQWDMWPEDLEPEVLSRIPVRYNFDNRYNTDKYQYRPIGGFTKMFNKMINNPNINLQLKTDFFNIFEEIPKDTTIIFTGPVDKYVSFVLGKKYKLPYRSVKFEWKNYNEEYHQKAGVINYPSLKEKFVRSTEYKYLTGQKHRQTTLSKEYFQWKGEPCYPVLTSVNKKKYLDIQKQTVRMKNVYFAGRLGKYKYLNMDTAIDESLNLFNDIKVDR
jgi:UDP-galactopyranose mutase